jgi:hypothetical protein
MLRETRPFAQTRNERAVDGALALRASGVRDKSPRLEK